MVKIPIVRHPPLGLGSNAIEIEDNAVGIVPELIDDVMIKAMQLRASSESAAKLCG